MFFPVFRLQMAQGPKRKDGRTRLSVFGEEPKNRFSLRAAFQVCFPLKQPPTTPGQSPAEVVVTQAPASSKDRAIIRLILFLSEAPAVGPSGVVSQK